MKILFVCLGNICRSPMAHGLLQHKAKQHNLPWVIDSAGTSDLHEGQLPDDRATACMKRHGIDITYQRSRPFIEEDLKEFDLIYVMDKANLHDVMAMTSTEEEQSRISLIMKLVYEQSPIDVPDPWYGGERGFENVYKMLDEATDVIIEHTRTKFFYFYLVSEIKKIKPSLSKGTRDFLPREVARRNYIFDTIKGVFRKYGFEEIETPAIEKLETLTGKYGDEGDKLLFKILNSGDYLKDVPADKLQNPNAKEWLNLIAEKGLRYDLTVPLARYVVMYQDKLSFPFKRFHIGPVWRADRPQKGRYQEFYQCDADVIGSESILNEVELTKIYLEVFQKLGMNITLRINNRKLIDAILNKIEVKDEIKSEVITIVDKLDKIEWKGEKGIQSQLSGIGLTELQVDDLYAMLYIRNYFDFNNIIDKATAGEIEKIMSFFDGQPAVIFDPTLMRGLDYYTGTIWEAFANDVKIGSIASGGRYDNLTEIFGGKNMSGVGISFGMERIYDVMEELNLFPETISQGVKVLLVPREEEMEEFAFQQTQALRDAGIAAEIFLGNVKKQKQFKYVEDKNIAYLVEVGGNEKESGKFRLRNTKTRETQNDLTLKQIIELLSAS